MAIPFRIVSDRVARPAIAQNVIRKPQRDFRLWLGIGLLLFSILMISHLISSAKARTPLLSVTHDIGAGTTLTDADLAVAQVAIPDTAHYLSDIDVALGQITTRSLAQGELLTDTAVGSTSGSNLRTVSVPIRAGHLPGISHGDLVDIWSTPSTDGMAQPGPPKLILSRAVVADSPAGVDPTSDTAISLTIPLADVHAVIAALRDGLIDVVAVSAGGQGQ
jgi:hypothetical protein